MDEQVAIEALDHSPDKPSEILSALTARGPASSTNPSDAQTKLIGRRHCVDKQQSTSDPI
jgi:hypothetical protein